MHSSNPSSILDRLGLFCRRQWIAVTLTGLLGFAGSAGVGFVLGIPEPAGVDEFSYLLAADTFAHGRLTNPPHPMWMHFESVHIIQQPTYMSKYPPAQGLIMAAGQVLTGQPIFGIWISFGLLCAAICWMLQAWVPARWAFYGALLAVINPVLGMGGYWAQSYWGGAVAASGGALVLGGARRLVRTPRASDAFVLALGLAILANSRPYEGILVSLPAAVVLLLRMFGSRRPALEISVARVILPILLVLSLTILAMGFYNLRVTGDPLRLPYQVHEETYGITPVFLWQSLRPEPTYHHQSLRDRHRDIGPELYKVQRTPIGFIVKNITYLSWWLLNSFNVLGLPVIAIFFLLLKWALRNRWGRFALVTYAVLIGGVSLETFLMVHYFAPITALNYFFVLNSLRLLRWQNRRVGQVMLWLLPLLTGAALITLVIGKMTRDNPSALPKQRAHILQQLKELDGEHLVIVQYGPGGSGPFEWVYNDAAIDASKVVWARFMDFERNCQLAQYFSGRQIWLLEVDRNRLKAELTPFPLDRCR